MVRLVLPKAVYVETIEVATRRLKVVGNFSALDYAASSVKKKRLRRLSTTSACYLSG
jgi:hypothetical protein